MKKLLASLLFCFVGSYAHADTQAILRSSYTATNETAYIAGTKLVSIDVGATSTGGSLLIYNSTFTTTSVLISSVALTAGNHYYGDSGIAVKGIYYATVNNVNGVTISYFK